MKVRPVCATCLGLLRSGWAAWVACSAGQFLSSHPAETDAAHSSLPSSSSHFSDPQAWCPWSQCWSVNMGFPSLDLRDFFFSPDPLLSSSLSRLYLLVSTPLSWSLLLLCSGSDLPPPCHFPLPINLSGPAVCWPQYRGMLSPLQHRAESLAGSDSRALEPLRDESSGCVGSRRVQAVLIDIPSTALPARPGSQLQCCSLHAQTSLEWGPALQPASSGTQILG